MRILVTGGAGSIGSEVVRHCVRQGHAVRVLDICEESIWSLKLERPEIDAMIGDVQSLDDVRRACDGQDVVIHCAAMKHVDLCERNPSLARRVNVDGTINVTLCHDRVVFISTDKAIEPSSVMGRTKREAERHVLEVGGNVVRFGNVIGSRGSLVPMVLRCAELGKPIALTDARMTRFFMTAQECVTLINEAATSEQRSGLFSPINPASCRVKDFIEVCRDMFAPGLEIVTTGIRPGERLHEPMELRSGEIVWSNHHAMKRTEIYGLLKAAGVAKREAA